MAQGIGETEAIGAQMREERLWNHHYILTLIVTFIINVSSIVLINLLPLYTVEMGGNKLIAGTLMTLLTVSSLLLRPTFGRQIDIRGRRVILVTGLLLFAIPALLFAFARNIPAVMVLRVLQGVGLSAYSTALGTVLSDVVPHRRISEGLGYFGISATIAMALAPSVGLTLVARFGYPPTFVATFAITLLGALCAYFIDYEKTRGRRAGAGSSVAADSGQATGSSPASRSGPATGSSSASRSEPATGSIPASRSEPAAGSSPSAGRIDRMLHSLRTISFLERTSLRPCIVFFFTVMAISSVFSFMTLYAQERKIENIGLFFTFYAISMIVVRLFTGRLIDRRGHMPVMIPAMAFTVALFLILAFAGSLPVVLAAAVCYGAGYGSLQPIFNTFVIRLSPPDRRGKANATYYMFLDTAFAAGSLLWGGIAQTLGFTAVFLVCAASVAVSIVLYFTTLHETLKKALPLER